MVERPHRPRRFRLDEIAEIVSQFKALTKTQNYGVLEACGKIAEERGRTREVIYALIRRFQPSVDGAEAYIKANALRLAMRAVRKANVDQSIDLLTRSNVGVLAPIKEVGTGGSGFFLSVQADTCGAVKIGVATAPGSYASLPQPLVIEQSEHEGETGEGLPASSPYSGASATGEDGGDGGDDEPKPSMTQPGVPHPNQGTFGRFAKPKDEWGARHQKELARARQRITEARRAAMLDKNRDVDV